MSILKKIEKALEKKHPFVVYKKPNSKKLKAFFQQNNTLFFTKNYAENGFVFAPFNSEYPSILIPENQSKVLEETLVLSSKIITENSFYSSNKSKKKHIKIVEKAIASIKNKTFKKVVVSRKELIEIKQTNIVEIYKRLLVVYPSAMVYIWYHSKVGLWLGATPETLVKVKGSNFETMSLAGTQLYNGVTKVKWKAKELDEQQVVTDYIVEKLKKVSKNIEIAGLKTVKSGSLLHLQTKISGTLNVTNLKLIELLHPTPAVCGFPKEKTKEFILQNEGYHREFYTGFLGELHTKNLELFVNLRCMQLQKNKGIIYIGGGITAESNAEKEWEETVAKSKIMKQVL